MSLVNKLPDEILQSRPNLAIYHAWILFIIGQYEASENLLLSFQQNKLSLDQISGDHGLNAFINLLLLYISEVNEKQHTGVLPDLEVLSFVPNEHLGMRNTADVLYAYLLDLQGRFAASEELLLHTVQRDLTHNGYTAVPICITRLARNLILQGQLKRASQLCHTYLTYIQKRGEKQFFIGGNLYMSLAVICREWNDLEEANKLMQAGFQANLPWKLPVVDATNYLTKARIQKAQGELDGALNTLNQLDRLIQGKSIIPDLKNDLRSLKIRLLLAKNNNKHAWSFVRLFQPIEPLLIRNEADHILLARLYIAEGQWSRSAHITREISS